MLYTVFMRSKQPTSGRGGLHALPALLPFLFLLLPKPIGAQTKPPAPPPLTLARAMASLPPPASGVLLAVGADKVLLPRGAEAPPTGGADIGPVASAFGEETQAFGTVTAIAPMTRVILNENPAPPDVTADLTPNAAFKMLAASLDDSQWGSLTSERGLGLTDLTDGTQQALFHALFRRGLLWVASQDPEMAKLPDDQRTDTRDVSDQISGVRIRLGQTTNIYLHDRKGHTIYFGDNTAEALKRLHVWSPKLDARPSRHNVALRATVPNTPKTGDLRLDDAALRVQVPLAGLRTAGELVTRVAVLLHKEIYADPHYAHRAVTLIGPAPSAPANDLLGALALAVAGTYRQVGPAFVLTDDPTGVGTRRKRLEDWEETARSGTERLSDQVGQAMLKRRASAARTLPTFGDSVALTPDQMKAMQGSIVSPEVPDTDRHYPFAKLTAAQQGWARRMAAAYEEQRASGTLPQYLAADDPQEADLTGQVDIGAETKVQMLVPTIEAPVDADLGGPTWMMFWPGIALLEENKQANVPKPVPPPAPPLMSLLRSRPHRAVLGHPRTAASVDALVAAMRKVGLNELWLDVFSGGKSHLSSAGGKEADILAEALTQTKGTGITVYADLSLLPWGEAPPEAVRDLSIEGETSREVAVHAHDRVPEPDFDDNGKPLAFVLPPVAVSPLSARVRDDLAALARGLSSRPGLAGFVWEDAGADSALGYTPAMRLTFLRAFHADPLDITSEGSPRGDVRLPTFDDAAADKALPALWDKARTEANAALLGGMRAALPPSAAARPILMEQSAVNTNWLASWDDPKKLPPPLRPLFTDWPYPKPERISAEAVKQGRVVVLRERVPSAADTDALARTLQADLAGNLANGKSAWGGFVLDFADEEATRGDHPLAGLVEAAAREGKARAH